MRIVVLAVCWVVSILLTSELATSPVLAKIVFSSHRDDARYEIYTMDTHGGSRYRLRITEPTVILQRGLLAVGKTVPKQGENDAHPFL